jgi:predicted DNA-binding transcriptional regulator YafY
MHGPRSLVVEPRLDRKRLVADRFKRIWSVVEFISDTPGLTRKELADQFALSERQLQADLNVIRDEMGLPLTRVHGYRFADTRQSDQKVKDLTLRDLHTLFLVVHRASEDPAIPQEAFAEFVAKLPNAFPPPLQPLVRKTLCPYSGDEFGPTPEVYAHLAEALLRHRPVKLNYPPRNTVGYLTEPIVDPEILLPHKSSWYLIGRCHQRKRDVMFCLDGVDSVSFDL